MAPEFVRKNARNTAIPRTATLTTATVTAKALSAFETVELTATVRGATVGALELGGAPARLGLPPATRLAAAAGGVGGLGAAADGAGAAAAAGNDTAGAAGAGLATGAAAPAGAGPLGNVGNLIVGAAVGLGGKLMRTVSFLG